MPVETFGKRLKALRKGKGFKSCESFADALEKKRQTVASWESDRTEPAFEDLVTLADYFNVTLDYMIAGKNLPQNVEKIDIHNHPIVLELKQEIEGLKVTLNNILKTLGGNLGKSNPAPNAALVSDRQQLVLRRIRVQDRGLGVRLSA